MTKNQLIKRVLLKLREIEADETPSSEATAVVGPRYDECYAFLNDKALVTWALDGEIPDSHAESMVTIVAAKSADDFHVDETRYQRLQFEAFGQTGFSAMDNLEQLAHVPYIPTSEPEYY